MAEAVIDGQGSGSISSNNTTEAITAIVTTLLGVSPTDDPDVQQLFATHVSTAMQNGASASAAVKSAFVLGCLSPSVSSIGS